jgi:predicted transposase/invertase (TIGR01784 family)
MNQNTKPHDTFFKETFSRVEVVQSFIEEFLPQEIKERLNIQNIKRVTDSFTTEELDEYLADMVYRTEYDGQQTLVTLLFEHKSYPQKYPHLQLIQYILNIWKEEQKQNRKLSIVIPIIIHHGNKKWRYRSLRSYFKGIHPSLLKFVPEFEYLLFSLNDSPDEKLINLQNIVLGMTTMLMKHSHDSEEDFLKLASFWADRLNKLDAQDQMDFIKSVFVYMENVMNLTQNKLNPIFTEVTENVNIIAMTIAEQRTEELTLKYIKGLWEKGLDADFIADAFKLPVKKVKDIIKKIKELSD